MGKREVFVNITKESTQRKKAAISCLPIYREREFIQRSML